MIQFSDYRIEPIELSDTSDFFNLVESNRNYIKRYFQITAGSCNDLQSTENYLSQKIKHAERREFYFFKLTQIGTSGIIGCLMLKSIDWRVPKGEIGYFIDRKIAGNGIASRAVGTMINYCFKQMKMKKIFLRIAPENTASRRVAEKNGFELEGRLKREFRLETGELTDILYYGRVR